jgi:hypothetical protein
MDTGTGKLVGRLPMSRTEGLVVTDAANEVLVYDTEQHHIHHLNQVTALVWRALDGTKSVPELVRTLRIDLDHRVDELTVRVALTTLADADLLAGELAPDVRVTNRSRRKLLKQAGVAGAGAAIVSITAPLAAHAQSGCITPSPQCNGGHPCASGCQCSVGVCVPV